MLVHLFLFSRFPSSQLLPVADTLCTAFSLLAFISDFPRPQFVRDSTLEHRLSAKVGPRIEDLAIIQRVVCITPF